jgi:hypothetical protein
MADPINIGAKITIDASGAARSTSEVTVEMKKLKDAVNDAKLGSQEYVDAQAALSKAQGELAQATGTQQSAFAALKDQLTSTVPALGGVEEGASSLGKELLVLAANPIVLMLAAIVAALAFLYEAFTYSVEGGKKVAQMFAGVKAAVDVIIDRIMAFGQGLIKILTGDMSGFTDIKNSFSGITEQVEGAYTAVSKATAALQALAIQQRNASVDRAAQNAAIVKSKELLNDETASIEDRKNALKIVSDQERKISQEDLAMAQEKLEQEKIIWGQEKEGLKKHAQDIADAEIEISGLQEQSARKEIALQRQTRTLNKQEKDQVKQANDAAKAKEKAAREEEIEYKDKLLKLEQTNTLDSIKDTYAKEQQALEFKISDEKTALQKSFNDGKITRQQYNTLLAAQEKVDQGQRDQLKAKHQKEVEANNIAFEKQLAALTEGARKEGEDDARQKERDAITAKYSEQRILILNNEKLTADQREKLLAALAAQAAAQQKALNAKFGIEDDIKALASKKKLLDSQYNLAVAEGKKTYALELQHYNQDRALDRQALVDKKATAQQLTDFDTESTNARIALSDKEKQAKEANAQAIGGALTQLSDLVGKQTIAGKVLAVASAVINTWQGATKALNNPYPLNIIAFASTIAAGLIAVKNIVATPVPGGGSGGSVPSAPSVNAPLTPQVASTTINPTSTKAIGNAAQGGIARSYVVESDVTNKQQRATQLQRAARIG